MPITSPWSGRTPIRGVTQGGYRVPKERHSPQETPEKGGASARASLLRLGGVVFV